MLDRIKVREKIGSGGREASTLLYTIHLSTLLQITNQSLLCLHCLAEERCKGISIIFLGSTHLELAFISFILIIFYLLSCEICTVLCQRVQILQKTMKRMHVHCEASLLILLPFFNQFNFR